MDFKNLGIMAVLGSIGMLWGNIKSWFAYFSSYIVVTVKLDDSVLWQVMVEHCRNKYRESRFGQKNYSTAQEYIRPKGRYGHIAQANTPQRTFFWNGLVPLMLGISKSDAGSALSITFIRGTFDIEKMLIEAVEGYDEELHSKDQSKKRFYVRKMFGRELKQNNNDDHDSPLERSFPTSSDSNNVWLGRSPLKWKKEDLTPPISDVPFQNLAYNGPVKLFKEEIVRWKNSETWHKDKGLPWRMGAGIFGPPGTGKTSFCRAVGQELDMPIHVYDLTTMSNEELTQFWRRSLSSAPCIVLFEDLDRVFDEGKNVKNQVGKAPLTLDCLLNCINGVEPADGILVLVTANDISRLDPALGVPDHTGKSSRPGRLDRVVHFGSLEEQGRRDIANRILSDCTDKIEEQVKLGEGETGAQFESRCAKLALEHYWGGAKVYGVKTD